MRYQADYAAAGVPMLPVVAPGREVVQQIVLYSWAMVACSFLLIPASSWIYAAVAVPLGLWFLSMAHLLHTRVLRGAPAKPMTLFHLSNLYPGQGSRWPGRSMPRSACRSSAWPGLTDLGRTTWATIGRPGSGPPMRDTPGGYAVSWPTMAAREAVVSDRPGRRPDRGDRVRRCLLRCDGRLGRGGRRGVVRRAGVGVADGWTRELGERGAQPGGPAADGRHRPLTVDPPPSATPRPIEKFSKRQRRLSLTTWVVAHVGVGDVDLGEMYDYIALLLADAALLRTTPTARRSSS